MIMAAGNPAAICCALYVYFLFVRVPKMPRTMLPLISLPTPLTTLLKALFAARLPMPWFLPVGRRMVLLMTLVVALLAAFVVMRSAFFRVWLFFLAASF